MTDYARDSQGRPVSADGLWVWNGTEWEAQQPVKAEPEPQVVELQGPVLPAASPSGKSGTLPASGRYARSISSTSLSNDEMSLARLAAITVSVLLALGGAVGLTAMLGAFLVARAFANAMTGAVDPAASGDSTFIWLYGVAFALAVLAAFCVLYAAQVPKALLGAVLIVVSSLVGLFTIPDSLILLLPVLSAMSTVGFVKKADR